MPSLLIVGLDDTFCDMVPFVTGIAFSNDHNLMGLTQICADNILLDRGDQELSFEILVVGVGWILASTCCFRSWCVIMGQYDHAVQKGPFFHSLAFAVDAPDTPP